MAVFIKITFKTQKGINKNKYFFNIHYLHNLNHVYFVMKGSWIWRDTFFWYTIW